MRIFPEMFESTAGLSRRAITAAARIVRFAAVLAAAAVLPAAALAQTVSGELTDVQRKIVFNGAIVTLRELDRSATADEHGRFRLSNVPSGRYTLVISYVGARDTVIPIQVGSDGLAMGEVVVGADEQGVEEIVVYGQSAALANALSQERSADNLVSVLDTDAMGQFPDQNVAEALRRLTGVTVATDQGEGRYVVIRGMDPDLNSTSINGVRATAAEPRRALQLDVVPSDVLDGLEIHKTLTPDMDGDAIGGSINVKTLSAFSRKGPYLKATAEGQYNEQSEEWDPKLSVAGSNIFSLASGARLGVAGALSWNDRSLLVNNNEADDWETAAGGNDFTEEFELRLYNIERERIGAVLNFDLDVSDTTSWHLYTLYSRFTDTELRNRLTFDLGGLDESTLSSVRADYAEAELTRDTKDREQEAETLSIALGSELQREAWLFEPSIGYSYSRERTPNGVDGAWVAEYESGDGLIPADVPVLTLDRSNAQIPVVESNFFAALQNDALFELDELETLDEKNEDTQFSLRLDASRETDFGALKFGVKGRWREKTGAEDVGIFSGDGTFLLSDVPDAGGAEYGFPTPIGPLPNPAGTRGILAGGAGIDFEDLDSAIDSNTADFSIDENIFSAYGMATWYRGGMTLIAGVRVEHTELDSTGNEVEFVEEGSIVDGVPLPEDTVFVSTIARSNSYTDVLPSANLRFDFNESLMGRASVYRSVVRPRVEDVAFRVAIEDDEAELGNPSLDPFRAWNVDASLSYYPTDLSVLSVGLFYKRIEDFIFVQTLDDFEFEGRIFDEATTALNGDDADVLGVEFTYQQHFGFLGPPFDGFLVAVNYTYVESEGNTGERDVDLPLQSANIGSFMLGYDKYGLDVRLAMKYRDRYIDELVEPGLDRFTDDNLRWDLTAKYRVSDNWIVYAEVANLGDEPEFYYAGRRDRVLQYDEFGTTSTFGVQFIFQ